jgi:hypothetical protein
MNLTAEMKLRPLKTEPDAGELKLGTSLHHGKLKVGDSSDPLHRYRLEPNGIFHGDLLRLTI